MNDTDFKTKETQPPEKFESPTELTLAGKSSMQGPVEPANPKDHLGEFDIIDWSDYPKGPKPEGPFKLIDDDQYAKAREQANEANREIHRANPDLKKLQIHEIKPVRFGGDPVDPNNKITLTPKQHMEFTVWWNRKKAEVQG